MTSFRFDDVLNTVGRLSADGWSVTNLAEADGYPILVLADPITASEQERDQSTLLIAAGIHGEEPGAVVGLLRWLEQHARIWVGQLHMHIFPCLNPWGFERGIRFAANGNDLNREFDEPRHPATQAFNRWIARRQFDLFMDLHEDCDFSAMYLYELLDPWPGVDGVTLGRRILDHSSGRVQLSDGDDVGASQTARGLISGPFSRREAAKFEGRPIAIEVYAHHAPHVVTVETPGLADLTVRADLHTDALQLACNHLTRRNG